jgi:glyoxylate/hydroxypyruvate reductase A
MALLINFFFGKPEDWKQYFAREMPDLDVRIWPDAGNRDEIDVIACGWLPEGEFKTFPNLKLIVSLLAGPDHLLHDPAVPKHVPIVRAGNPEGDQMMTETTLLHTLRHHRNLPAYAAAQAKAEWVNLPRVPATERKVGVMGLGLIGLAAAKALYGIGFQVAGWVRRPRDPIEGVEVFAGRDQLDTFLKRSEIIVNLLPLTTELADILDARAFALMPKGGAIVNLGRGGHVVDKDLIAALDSEHLAAATLDAFRKEPLPPDDPFWKHPKITILPHASRRVEIKPMMPRLAHAIRCLRAGKPLENEIDRKLGY